MGQSTEEQLTTDIEGTRQDLGRNLDALNEKVNPSRIVERRKEATRSKLSNMREKVMGSAHTASSRASSVGDSASGRVSDAKDSVSDAAHSAVDTAEEKAEGNPMAAGLIAFGAGWLISSLIPASEKEAQAASRLVDAAKEHGQPIVDEAKSVGQDMGQNLQEKVSDAADEVKSSAQSSAQTVKEEGQSSAQDVKDEAQSSAQNIKDTQQR
jgi:ElaB/YqjD/DUF883 family membrane-anchored ribosome-binding protein